MCKGAYLINSNISRTISILLLTIGILITTTSFIGCFGAHLEHTGFLNTYSSITAIALILELGDLFIFLNPPPSFFPYSFYLFIVAMGLAYSHTSQVFII